LAEALAKCGLIERSGQGMNLMYESAIKQGKALPSLLGTSADAVRLTLHGSLTSPAFVRYLEQLGSERTRSFSTYDLLALDTLRREQELPPNLRAQIPALVAAGAIEAMGRGRRVRRKGLDQETNKTLLLKHIRENAADGSQMEEFRQVLPALQRSQIQVLLRELRTVGAVHVVGATKAARWYPDAQPSVAAIETESR